MATVIAWSGSWTSSGGASDLKPGQAHNWTAWGFNYGDAIDVTAHPVVGAPGAERILEVQNLRAEGDPSGGRRIFYTVRNVGTSSVPGYAIGYAWIRP